MSIFGALINNTMKIKKSYFLITGLGPFFFSKKPKYILHRFIKKIIFTCLRVKKNYLFIFQNSDDLEIFLNKKLSQNHNSTVIRGNGINMNQFKYFKRDSSNEIIFLFASKLIYSKGIIEFMNASKELNGKYKGIKFHIAGNYDPSNPDSISREDFEMIQASEYFEYQGFVDIRNMQECLYKSTILVLPSYAEGLPKIALEAAATGMPLILTNVRGCRDCLIEEKNGVLVNIKDHEDIKNAMQKFIDQKELINAYGKFSSELVNEKFSLDIITQQFLAIID
jgi:glycosyltransferase involved in cell wall biosynthesis|tara:strand:- start:752 stop:1594 length:843 start_codon:yes stop_codon:yes gene_type:complete